MSIAARNKPKMSKGLMLLARCLKSAVLAVLLAFLPSPSLADVIPGTSFQGRAYYFTGDMRPVTINIGFDAERITKTFNLPRAFLMYATGYEAPKYDSLPDIVTTTWAIALLTFEGEALSIAVANRAYLNGTSRADAMRSFRDHSFRARLSALEFSPEREQIIYEGGIHRGYDNMGFDPNAGLERFEIRSIRPTYVGDFSSDEFISIQCPDDDRPGMTEEFLKRQHCSYRFVLERSVAVTAHFSDFRFWGGRDFANQRIRQIRQILCTHIECDGVGEDGTFLLWTRNQDSPVRTGG